MKKYILVLIITLTATHSMVAQVRGVKIGYIDMEYILEKVPDYAEAKNQL
jgi:Skp family chaperone for outer membrane proteins